MFDRVENMSLNGLHNYLPLINGAFDRFQVYQKAEYIRFSERCQKLIEIKEK